MKKDHWDLLYNLPYGDVPYVSKSSWCVPSGFVQTYTTKETKFVSDDLLAPQPIAEFKPHVWKQISKKK